MVTGVAFLFLIGLFVSSTQAANSTWTGSAGTTNMNAAADWGGTVAPAGNIWIFTSANASSSTTLSNDFAANFNVGGIVFNSGALAYIINGNSINLSGGITNNGTSLETFGTAFALQGAETITTTSGGGNLTFNGIISAAFGLTFNGSGTTTLNGADTYGTTGKTNIISSGATVILGNATALGSANNSLSNNGILNLNGNNQTVNDLSGSGSITNTSATALTLTVGNANTAGTYSGQIGNGANGAISLTKSGTGTLTLSGSNSYTGLTTLKNGTLVLAANGALGTNGLSATPGTGGSVFTVINNAGVTNSQTGNFTMGSSGGGSYSGTFNNAGTYSNSSTNSFGSGVTGGAIAAWTFINSGTANINSLQFVGASGPANSFYVTNSGSLNVGALYYGSYGSGTLVNLGGATLTAGAGGINSGILPSGAAGVATWVLTNNGTLISTNAGITMAGQIPANTTGEFLAFIQGAGTSTISSLGIGVQQFQNSTASNSHGNTFEAMIVGGVVTNSGSIKLDTVYQTAVYSNNLYLLSNGAANLYASNITIGSTVNGGSSGLTNEVIIGTGTSGQGTMTIGNFSNSFSSTFNGYTNIYLWNGGVIQAQSGQGAAYWAAMSNTLLSVTNVGGIFDVNGFTNTIAQGIAGTAGLSITNSTTGAGTLTLGGVNSFSGNLTLASTNSSSGAANLSITGLLGSGSYSGTIAIGSGDALTFAQSGSQTLSGAISGGGNFTQSGTGTTTLSASNSYTGGTIVSAGNLTLGNSSALGATTNSLNVAAGTLNASTFNVTAGAVSLGNGTITGNGTLTGSGYTATNSGAAAISEALAGAGASFTQSGSGTTTLSASNSYTGGTIVSAGNLTLGNTNALGNTNSALAVNGTLNFSGNSATQGALTGTGVITNSGALMTFAVGANNSSSTFGGQIMGPLSLTKLGTGTLTATGNNTFTGTTTITGTGSALDLSGGGHLSGTTNVLVQAGATLLLGNTGAANSVNSTSALTLAGGTLSMGGSNAGGSVKTSVLQAFGALTLTANSIIDFSMLSGNSTLTFASITGLSANTLSIWNYSSASGSATTLNDSSSLTSSELANISFFSGAGTGQIGAGAGFSSGTSGEIVPVPEPSVVIVAALLLGWLLFFSYAKLFTPKTDERL